MASPLNCGATLAVKVTACPKFDGFNEEAKAVVALLTTWLTAFDVLPEKFESPLYTALTHSAFGRKPDGSIDALLQSTRGAWTDAPGRRASGQGSSDVLPLTVSGR